MKPNPMATASPAKKAKIQQLISAELKLEIPIDRAVFGTPVDLGNGEAFLTMRTDASFDERFSRPDQGVTYTRLDLQKYLDDHDAMVTITSLPMLLNAIVAMINPSLPIPLEMDDFVDVMIEDPTLLAIPIQANPGSLLFQGHAKIALRTSIQSPMLIATSVGTFPIYTP